MPYPLELLCIGNAVVDVFADANSAWLDTLGLTEPLQHISRGQAQQILNTLTGSADAVPVLCSGGGAANAAKIAAMLNVKTVFAGCVGAAGANDDNLPGIFIKDLRTAGVFPLLNEGTEKTGVCFIFNCGNETRIAAAPGAALEFSECHVPEDLVAKAEAIMLDGYMLDRRPLVQHILQLANRRGIPIALDAASVFQIKEKTEDILQYSRNYPLIVFMNADESIVFYNTIKKSREKMDFSDEREKEALILRDICPVLKYITEGELFPIIVIKLGGGGVAVLAGGNIYREETFTIIPRNTVGAGDAFGAAFLSAWIRGKSIRECAALGNKVAREVLMVPGTGIKKEKLKKFAKYLR